MRFLAFLTLTAAVLGFVSAQGSKIAAAKTDGPTIELVYPPALAEEAGFLDVSKYKHQDGHAQSRSPCPFLNTAANHGILPFDGKKIHAEVIYRLLKKVNVPEKFSATLRDQILKVAAHKHEKDSTHPINAIDLADLNEHELIEHDLSMSRWDVRDPQKQGANFADPKLVDDLLQSTFDFSNTNGNKATSPATNIITVTSIGMWHNKRREMEIARKQTPNENFRTKFLCSGECFLLLFILGREGKIKGADARSFFIDEKFPAGWTPPKDMNSLKALKGVAECGAAFALRDSWLSWLNKPSSWFGEDSRFGNWWKAWGWSNHGETACEGCEQL